MKLKTLEISGFKSFADKTKIEFMPGMTGIVGPNGSGKSNIIEAIRWVLGEQSARDLRGTKMTDVIFSGSANRKALNRAEVAITFDNSDHYLKSDFTEVQVMRRLFRNGDSQYLMNGQDCRLRDILELFMDTGLGRESFSIISQGRVEEIFNSKPEDRRSIIEEVAGVYKYKQNKDKAERELGTTRDYLNRVNDIIAELEDQLEPLAKQSSLAKDYLEQKRRFDELDQTRLVIEIRDHRLEKQTVDQRVEQVQTAVTDAEARVNDQSQTVSERKARRDELMAEKDKLQATLLRLTQEVEQLSGLQANAATRTEFQAQQVAELTARIEAAKAAQKTATAELATVTAALTAQQAEVAEVNRLVKTLSADKVEQQEARLRKRLTTLQDDYVEQMQALTTLHNERHFLTQNHERGGQQSARLDVQTEKLQAAVTDLLTQQEQLAQTQADAEQKQQALTEQVQSATNEHAKLVSDAEQAQKNWYNALGVQQRAQARAESLAALSDDHAGFYQGVKAILNQRSQFDGLIGPVADLITVSKDLTKAVETALGAQLQQLVVRDEQTARQAVAYLTKQRAGRATFLPLTTIHGRTLSQSQLDTVATMPGYVGLASQLVQAEAQISPVVDYLLGTTVIATDLPAAIEIAKAGGHRFRIVTTDGQVMNASGSITGGANRNQQAGLLSQRTEATELAAAIKKMTAELTQQEQHVAALQKAAVAKADTLKTLRQQLATATAEAQQVTGQGQLLTEQITVAKRRLEASQFEQRQQNDQAADYQTQLAANEKKTAAVTAELDALKAEQAARQVELTTLTADVSTKAAQLQEKQQWLAAATAQVTARQADQHRLQETVTAQTAQLNADQHRLTVVTDQQMAQGKDKRSTAEQLADAQKKQQTTSDRLTQTETELTGIVEMVAATEQDLERAQGLQQSALREMNDLRATQSRLATLLDGALTRLSETYHVSFDDAQVDLSDADLDDIKKQLKLLKLGLDELGDVNIGAIEEYERVSERYDFLDRQRKDLLTSQQQLEETMAEMDGEVSVRFKQAFDEVAVAFSEIFGEMFGGGKAELVLTDPANILTTGIDIMAQPPGKKFQRMSLLSGGERSLTAITLLFAILAVRPVPFAILDETEAALDEANVVRFARYLRNFGGGTQFIVITHRKGTMVNANVLYGVTMQESGVSKMVSVSLDDVESVS
ncbi:chromosome segregation protein SMC [Furfurilactobacillus sp. WILCCON 0119]